MRKFSSSEKQWILSFLFVDALFWIFVFGGCAMSPVNCLETASFGPAFFYAPFWLLSPDFGSVDGYGVSLITGPLIGFLCHALIGFGFGYFLHQKSVRWFISIPIAFAVLFGIIIASLKIAFITGMIR